MRLFALVLIAVTLFLGVAHADSRRDRATALVAEVLPKETWGRENAVLLEEYAKAWVARYPAYAPNLQIVTQRMRELSLRDPPPLPWTPQ